MEHLEEAPQGPSLSSRLRRNIAKEFCVFKSSAEQAGSKARLKSLRIREELR